MNGIKQRRIETLEVACHPGTKVGGYVPFYFCPRSVMLYLLYQANHPNLTYREGQGPIVHLESELRSVVQSADANRQPWAFTTSNAGASYAQFFSDLSSLAQIDWDAVRAADWRSADI